MSAWRIDDTDSACPVHLNLGGPYPLRLTVTEAMSLLRTAPKMAGKWERFVSSGETMLRLGIDGMSVAAARADGYWSVRSSKIGTEHGTAADVEAAMQAADAALRAAGWMLEEG